MSWSRFLRLSGLSYYIKFIMQALPLMFMVSFCAIQLEHEDPNKIRISNLELISEPIPEETEEDDKFAKNPNIFQYQELEEWEKIQGLPKSVEEEIEDYKKAKKKVEEIYSDDGQELNRRIKELQEQYHVWYAADNSLFNYYAPEDLQYLFRAVETEVHGGDVESKANVASVIINRLNQYGASSFKEIVTSPNQFVYTRTKIDDTTLLACEYAFQVGDTTQGSLNFHSGKKTDTFSGRDYVFTDSVGHHFYN